jgi:ABC-type antimicrobial peptide transport system permease subunit
VVKDYQTKYMNTMKVYFRFSSAKFQELSALLCISLTVIAICLPLSIYESLENQVNQWAQAIPSDSFYVMLYPRQWAEQDTESQQQQLENLSLFAPPETIVEDVDIQKSQSYNVWWFTSARIDAIRQLPHIATIAWARAYSDELYFKDNVLVINLATPDFFDLSGLKIAQGRSPTYEDSPQVAIVGDQVYKSLFEGTQGIGQRIVPSPGGYKKELTIIGVLEPAGGAYARFSEGIDWAVYILDQEPIDISLTAHQPAYPITEIWVKPEIGKQREAINIIHSYLQKEFGEETAVYILTSKDYVRLIGGIQARQTYVPGMNWVIGLLALAASLNSGLVIYALLSQRRFVFGIRRSLGLRRGALILEEFPFLLIKGAFVSVLGILIAVSLAPSVGKAIQPVEFYVPVRVSLGFYTGFAGLAIGLFVWSVVAGSTMLIFLQRTPSSLLREKNITFGSGKKEIWLSGLGFALGVFALIIILGLRDGTTSQFDRILGWAGGERAGAFVDWLTFDTQYNEKPAELSTFDYLLLDKTFPDATFGWLGRTSGLPGINMLEASASMENIRPPILISGRWINIAEEQMHAHVAVLGRDLASRLAKEHEIDITDLVGQTWEAYKIVGVMDEWPARYSMGYRSDVAYVPVGVLEPGDGYYYPGGQIAFIAPVGMKMSAFLEQIRLVFESNHPEGAPQFILAAEKISEMLAWRMRVYTLMGMFAVIVLIIGGVGIMNLLLMMIIGRWREIGIRLAVGASRGEIIRMVLAKAFQITLFAALIGGLAGTGIALLIQHQSGWPLTVYPYWLVAALGIALFSALVFGGIPAWWAATRTPTEMLRME